MGGAAGRREKNCQDPPVSRSLPPCAYRLTAIPPYRPGRLKNNRRNQPEVRYIPQPDPALEIDRVLASHGQPATQHQRQSRFQSLDPLDTSA